MRLNRERVKEKNGCLNAAVLFYDKNILVKKEGNNYVTFFFLHLKFVLLCDIMATIR